MAGPLIYFAVWAASELVGYVIRPHVRPKPADNFGQIPFAKEGMPIPLAYGTNILRTPGVFLSDAFGSVESNNPDSHFEYHLKLAYGICSGPITRLREVRFDDKVPKVTYSNLTAEGLELVVSDPKLFAPASAGRSSSEGGVIARIYSHYGTGVNSQDPQLIPAMGADVSRFPGLAYLSVGWPQNFTEGAYLGNSPYLKPFAIVFDRLPDGLGLGGSKHLIYSPDDPTGDLGIDSNPAHIIYDLLTETGNAAGMSAGLIDTAALTDLANACKTEGTGLSLMFDRVAPVLEHVHTVCEHIDCVGYRDPLSGKLRLKLIRFDYNPVGLQVFGDSSILSLRELQSDWSPCAGHVRVEYQDRRKNFATRVAQAFSQDTIENMDAMVSEDLVLSGYSNSAAATAAAARTGVSREFPLRRFSLVMNREAYTLRPGDVFKAEYTKTRLSQMILRATRVVAGAHGDSKIDVEAVQDQFAVGYLPPNVSTTDWQPYVPRISNSHASEAPKSISASTACKLMVMAARSADEISKGVIKYDIYSQPEGGSETLQSANVTLFTPCAFLTKTLKIGEETELEFGGLQEEALYDTWVAALGLDPDETTHTVTAIASNVYTAALARGSAYYAPNGIATAWDGTTRRCTVYASGAFTTKTAFPAGLVVVGDAVKKLVKIKRDPITTGATVIQVGDELIAFEGIVKPVIEAGGGDVPINVEIPGHMYGLARGVEDTSPLEWVAGTPIWFLPAGTTIINATITDLLTGNTVRTGDDYAAHVNFNRTPLAYAVRCVAKTASVNSTSAQSKNCWRRRNVPSCIDIHDRGQSRTPRGARQLGPCHLLFDGKSYPEFISDNALITAAPRARGLTGEPIQKGFRSGACEGMDVVGGSGDEFTRLVIWPENIVDNKEGQLVYAGPLYDFDSAVEIKLQHADLVGGRVQYVYPLALDISKNGPYIRKDSSVQPGTGKPSNVLRVAWDAFDYQADADNNSRQCWMELQHKVKRAPVAALSSAVVTPLGTGVYTSGTSIGLSSNPVSLKAGDLVRVSVYLDSSNATLNGVVCGAVALRNIRNPAAAEPGFLQEWMGIVPADGSYNITGNFSAPPVTACIAADRITGVVAPDLTTNTIPSPSVLGGSGFSNNTNANPYALAGAQATRTMLVLCSIGSHGSNNGTLGYDLIADQAISHAPPSLPFLRLTTSYKIVAVPAGGSAILEVGATGANTNYWSCVLMALADAGTPP